MFDLEDIQNLHFVSEVLRSVMYRRIKKHDLNYCEDGILDLIELTVKIPDMFLPKELGILQ